MKNHFILICMACLWACHTNINREAIVSGEVSHAVGNKMSLEICGQDTILQTTLDSMHHFMLQIPLSEGTYARLSNGKTAIPLYLAPGKKIELDIDIQKIKKGDYSSVLFKSGGDKENRLMTFYYEHQYFPSSQELFSRPPKDFQKLMRETVIYNDSLIDHFLNADSERYDQKFVKRFKLQVKVPLAMSYFYYPTYHPLIDPRDTTSYPENFNIFDRMLPKNTPEIYNSVYRYKTYETSYWNNLLAMDLEKVEEHDLVNAYFDRLTDLNLHPQIATDVARSFFNQQITGLSQEEIQQIKQRIKGINSNN